MREVANLKRIGEEFSKQDAGTLSIATTHTQARYVLPEPVAQLRRRYPKVQRQPAPGHARAGGAHAARRRGRDRPGHRIAGRLRRTGHPALLRMAARAWWCRAGHPLAARGAARRWSSWRPSRWSPTTPPFTGRTRIDQAFARARLQARQWRWKRSTPTSSRPTCAWAWAWASWPRWRCATSRPAATWSSRPLGHLFGQNVARVAFKRGAYLRNFVYAFAELLSDRLTRALIQRAHDRRRRRLPDSEPHADTATAIRTPALHSRLPQVGTTIFTVMSALAQRARRRQPGPGLPGLRLRPGAARRRRPTPCARA